MKPLYYGSLLLILSGCASSPFAAFQTDSSRYDIALEELRIEVGDLKQALHAARVEVQLLEEQLLGKGDEPKGEVLLSLETKLQTLEKNQERIFSDLRALSQYLGKVSSRMQKPVFKETSPIKHRVQKGDTLEKIAGRYALSVEELKEKNGLRGDAIRIGQELLIE